MTEGTIKQQKPASLPKLQIGYFLSILIVVIELAVIFTLPPEALAEEEIQIPLNIQIPFFIASIGAYIYWLVSIFKIHAVLREKTDSTYPIVPGRAVGFHFLPFYNIYWIFKWPSEVIKFINVNLPDKKMKLYAPGLIILSSGLVGELISSGLATMVLFLSLKWMVRNIKEAIERPVTSEKDIPETFNK